MMQESNSSNPITQNEKPKRGFLFAVLLGLLAPVFTFVISLPFFLLAKISDNLNITYIIAGLIGGEIGGLIASVYITVVLFFLFGTAGITVFSWFKHRSKKLAVATLLSALILQMIILAFLWNWKQKDEQKQMDAIDNAVARDQAYTQYASIGDVRVEPKEPFDYTYSDGSSGEWVKVKASLFKKLVFSIPVSVSHAGTYEVNIRYSDKSDIHPNSESPTEMIQTLGVGANLVNIELVAGSAPNLGYELPSSVQGKVSFILYYIASRKETEDSFTREELDALRKVEKDPDFYGYETKPFATVSKFVEQKEIQF